MNNEKKLALGVLLTRLGLVALLVFLVWVALLANAGPAVACVGGGLFA